MDLVSEINSINNTKKRPKRGRVSDVAKKLKLASHQTGEDCNCKRFQCFTKISEAERQMIIKQFNAFRSYDEQSQYLGGLVSCIPISKHRPRKDENEADLHSYSYKYKIRVIRNENVVEITVCYKAMLSIHGITAKRLQTIQKSLATTGIVFKDGRGKHGNRPHKLSVDILESICNHIQSFKGRQSHYSLSDSKRVYLPSELNVKKMHAMYLEKFPHKVSYETYRNIFCTKFNISFGYPRTDTCSFCDEAKIKIDETEKELELHNTPDLLTKLKKLKIEHELHLRKANTFYTRKRKSRTEAQKYNNKEAIVMDFQKNLSIPNITTNDVYYRRQLSFFAFNIHILSTQESFFYTYPEYSGHKGADEVSSMLFDFIFNQLSNSVRELHIYCDSCCGQNKNFTVIRFLHYLVHETKRLDKITVTFPVRGHSYMECDRNMGLINQKSYVELPDQWNDVIINSRRKPKPFKVVSCEDQNIFRSWTDFLSGIYLKKSPFHTRPIKELQIVSEHPRTIQHRDSYNGPMISSVVLPPRRKTLTLPSGEFRLPCLKYEAPVPISKQKYEDLQHLRRFCSEEAREFYKNLVYNCDEIDND